jgi:hypothetical protein
VVAGTGVPAFSTRRIPRCSRFVAMRRSRVANRPSQKCRRRASRGAREVEGSRVVTLKKAAVIVRCNLPCIEAFLHFKWCSSLNQTLHPTWRLTAKSADFFSTKARSIQHALKNLARSLFEYYTTNDQLFLGFDTKQD